MKNLILICVLLVSTATVSAQNWNSKKTKGNGSISTQERTIDDFDRLKVAGNFNIVITSNRTNALSIKTDENLMEYIITEVKEGALVIKMKRNYYLKPSNHKGIAIEIPLKSLQTIALAGSGSIRSADTIQTGELEMKMAGSGKINLNLEAKEVEVALSGSGRMELQGSSTHFEAILSGSGSIKAKDLSAEKGAFTVSGSGRIEANITDELEAKVSGSGSVRYLAKPTTRVNTKVSGSGSIREMKNH